MPQYQTWKKILGSSSWSNLFQAGNLRGPARCAAAWREIRSPHVLRPCEIRPLFVNGTPPKLPLPFAKQVR